MTYYDIISDIDFIIKSLKMTNVEKNKKKSVHATISDKSYNILEQYAEEFGSKSAVVDESLKILKKFKEPHMQDQRSIWCRAKDELKMFLVGKTTFLNYIKGEVDEAYTKNIAVEAIEWYLGKMIGEMTLIEFLEGLKGMWEVANYFYHIDLEKNKKGTFQMRFNHDLTNDYSRFWAGYFEKLLKDNWGCFVESFIRNESFYLIIRENHESLK